MSGLVFEGNFGNIQYLMDTTTGDLDGFEAELRCSEFRQQGLDTNVGFLASIKNADEHNNVVKFLDNVFEENAFDPRFVWLGMRTTNNRFPPLALDYFYLDGDTDVAFYSENSNFPWGEGQPSGFNNRAQRCVVMARKQQAQRNFWNDAFCDAEEGFPLCQINLIVDTENPSQNPIQSPFANRTNSPIGAISTDVDAEVSNSSLLSIEVFISVALLILILLSVAIALHSKLTKTRTLINDKYRYL